MKKTLKLILITFFLTICFLIPNFNGYVFADATIIPNSSSGIADANLYNALLESVNSKLGESNQITQLYSDSLNLITDGVLNLSNKNISNLNGISKLSLSSIKQLNLSYNNLTEVSANDLLAFTSLENLQISNNNITSLEISNLSSLKDLNASNNKLTSIDLSAMLGGTINYDKTINLNHNNISSIANIILPSETVKGYIIDVSFNKLSEFAVPNSVHVFNVGIQNIVENEIAVVQKQISFFEVAQTTYANINAKIYSLFPTKTIFAQLDKDNKSTIINTANKYVVEYFYGTNKIINDTKFQSFLFTIKPNKPTVKVQVDNEEFETIEKLTKKSTFKFFGNGTIYYKINSADWVEASSVEINEKGTYSISVKCKQNDVESETINFTISLEYKDDLAKKIIGITFLSAIIIVFAYFAIKYRKNVGFFKKNAKKRIDKSKE